MNKRLAAKLDMYRSVRDLRTGPNVALIGSISALNDAFTAHTATIGMIESLDQARAGFATGGAAAKTLARTQLETTLEEVDGIITAFAAATSNADLLAQVNREISDIEEMADETLRIHAASLIAKIAEPGMPSALLPYGLSPAKATLLGQRYTTFHGLINLPDERAQQESTYVQLIDTQFESADLRLDLIMDKLMRQFREIQPALYLNYKEARVINDAAAGVGSGGSGGGTGGGSSSSSGGSSSSSGEPSSSSGSSSSSL
jgi:hypothetical protein